MMREFDLIVIGGGVTGVAIARDASMRGIKTALVEKGDIGSGTSGRWHSMLQSGSRYVVTDTSYAAQCMQERLIMENIAPFARKATGGLFVSLEEDDPAFIEKFESSAAEAGIPVKWRTAAEIAELEPNVAPTRGGFTVPDAVFHAWKMVPAIAYSAVSHGAKLFTNSEVVAFEIQTGELAGVTIRSASGSLETLHAPTTVVAAGAWASDLGRELGLNIEVETAKGAMLVLPGEIVNSVVNRLRVPSSFDISVPLNGSTVFGTTSSIVESPEDVAVSPAELEELAIEALKFHPKLVGADRGEWRSYAGVRPLVSSSPGIGGVVSRKHAVFQGTVPGTWGIVGGSFTTHRAMAEDVTDRVADFLDIDVTSRTAFEPLAETNDIAWAAGAPLQASGISR
jgi:glycerol-3-phosphate dehydrogenase